MTKQTIDDVLLDIVICGLPSDCAMVDGVIIAPIRKKELAEDRKLQYEEAKQALLQYLLEGKPENYKEDKFPFSEIGTRQWLNAKGFNRANAAWERHIRRKLS